MKFFLYLLGFLSMAVAVVAAGAMKSDIQFILLMLGVIGCILGFGLASLIERLDVLASGLTKEDQWPEKKVPPLLPEQRSRTA